MRKKPEILFDLGYLRSVDPSDKAFVGNIITDFLELTAGGIDKMNVLFSEGNLEGLRKMAHKVKPDFACIGAASSEKIIAEIEILCAKPNSQLLLADLLKEITSNCKKICKGLESELKTNGK